MNHESEAAGALRLAGPLTIRRAGELHATLTSALANHESITLDIQGDADADISFVQLAVAAQASARAAGKQLRLARPASGPLLDVLTRGGFLAADAAGFWTRGIQEQ